MRTLRMLLESDDDSIKLKAAKAILDRSLGKPVQAVLVDSSAPELATRSAEDREAALLAALRAVRSERKVVVDANAVPAIETKTSAAKQAALAALDDEQEEYERRIEEEYAEERYAIESADTG